MLCIPWLGSPQCAPPHGCRPGLGSLRLVSSTADVYPKTKAEKLHPKQYFSCQRYLLDRLGTVNQAELAAVDLHLCEKQQTTQTGLIQVIRARASQCRNATKSTGSRLFNNESFQLLKFKLCCSSSCGFGDAHTSKFSHYLMSHTGNKHSGRHTATCGSHYTPQNYR